MQNTIRSATFIKIKQNIQLSINYLHLTTCQQMIENATPDGKPSDALFNGQLCTSNEIIILKEYLETARKLLAPIQMVEDELLLINRLRA